MHKADPTPTPRRWRQSLVAVFLVVLSSIGVVLTPVAWWVHSSLFDTDEFIGIVEPVFTDEEVTAALGEAIGDEVIVALDLQARLEERLTAIDAFLAEGLADALDLSPAARRVLRNLDLPSLANLSGPLAAAVEERIYRATDAFTRSEAFTRLLPEAVERAHRAAVALIRDDPDSFDNLEVVDGEIRWNLVPAVAAAIAIVLDLEIGIDVDSLEVPTLSGRIPADEAIAQLGEALGVELPPDFAQVTILTEEQLSGWQIVARQVDRLLWLVTVATVLSIVAAVWVSPHRRRTVVQLALGGAAGLLLAGIVQRSISDAVVAAVADTSNQEAVRIVLSSVLGGLQGLLWAVFAAALFVAIVAYLLGQPRWLEQFRRSSDEALPDGHVRRRTDAFIARHRDAFLAGGIVVALAAWWFIGIGLWSLLIVGGLLLAYLVYVAMASRRTDDIAEVPAPPTP